jgi:hypothetical protein
VCDINKINAVFPTDPLRGRGLPINSASEFALELGFVTPEEFDAWVVPADMTHPSAADK